MISMMHSNGANYRVCHGTSPPGLPPSPPIGTAALQTRGGMASNMNNNYRSVTLEGSPPPLLHRPPPSPAPSDSSNSNQEGGASPTSPTSHRNAIKRCRVCNDVAKSMHFGGLSCDSCKAFFRRSVQNNAYLQFNCSYEGKCEIGVASRKACQYCRFEKCSKNGMERTWVMSEDERRRMMEQRRKKKFESSHDDHYTSSDADQQLYSLSDEDQEEITHIISLYRKAYAEMPYQATPPAGEQSGGNGNGNGSPMGKVLFPWLTFLKRIAYFVSMFQEFNSLPESDRFLLLKTAITSAGIIMGSVSFDPANGRWGPVTGSGSPGKEGGKPKPQGDAPSFNPVPRPEGSIIPTVTTKNAEKVVPSELLTSLYKFFKKFKQICPDETMAMILILISLYSPELSNLMASDTVQKLQDKYINILDKYVKYRFQDKSTTIFPKAIVSLVDIRELSERTFQMHFSENSLYGLFKKFDASAKGSSSLSELNASQSGSSTPKISKSPVASANIDMKIIQKVLDLIVDSSIPQTLLPFFNNIAKKLAANCQQKRSISNQKDHLRKHNYSSKRSGGYRGSKRRMTVKQEDFEAIAIKEEIMDVDEETRMSPLMHTTGIEDMYQSTSRSSFINDESSVDYQSYSNYQSQVPMESDCQPSPQMQAQYYAIQPTTQADMYQQQQQEPVQMTSYESLNQSSPISLPGSSHVSMPSFSNSYDPQQLMENTSSCSSYPSTPCHSLQPQIHVTESPPNMSLSVSALSYHHSNHHHSLPSPSNQAMLQPLPSPDGSPSSSSSPSEDTDCYQGEYVDDLTDIERDVLTELMDVIARQVDGLDGIPKQIIDGLQRKLNTSSPPGM